MVEYQNWYQVLRPIGSFVKERSRVEILSLADESDLRLREKIRSMPFGLNRYHDAGIEEPFPASISEKSETSSYEEMVLTRNFRKSRDSETYLSHKRKSFQDQEEEIKTIFWNLLKTVDLECSDDINVEDIRDFLKRRQEQLGREEQELSDVDVFDKYGLGMHGRKLAGSDGEEQGKRGFPGMDELIEMIDKKVAERTKPVLQNKDMYDKNDPIKGKVGFRREELNGIREYTDLDEQLDFGDLDKDVDFKPFLVAKGRGRFDSKGNYISNETEGDKSKYGNGRMGKDGTEKEGSEDHRKSRRKKGKRGSGKGTESSDDDSRKNKSRKGRPRTASEIQRYYMEDLKKSRRYPEWDFPMCNYPKWVHRMYRMDQQKIGQLIKQGMGVPEYCPPWMMEILDNVWGAKDTKTRGEKPSNLESKKMKGKDYVSETVGEKRKGKETAGSVLGDRQGPQKDGDGRRTSGEMGDLRTDAELSHPTTIPLERGAEVGGITEERESSFGLGDFLGGYEKEILDLAELEKADSHFPGEKHRQDDSFDIDDLIAEYQDQLQREEDLLTGAEKKKKRLLQEKIGEMRERQEAAKKKIQERDRKHMQDEKIKAEADRKALEKEKELFNKKLTARITRTSGISTFSRFRGNRRSRKMKRSSAMTEPCMEYKSWPNDPAKDEECMRRFKVLLQGRNRIAKENEFRETAGQISLFEFKKATPPKTPCECVKLPIC